MREEPKQNRAHQTRANILAAANRAILRHGRDRFTMTDVIAEYYGSVGIIYRYFANRVELLDALYPDRVEGLNGPERKATCGEEYVGQRCYRVSGHGTDHRSRGGLSWYSYSADQLDLGRDDTQIEPVDRGGSEPVKGWTITAIDAFGGSEARTTRTITGTSFQDAHSLADYIGDLAHTLSREECEQVAARLQLHGFASTVSYNFHARVIV